MRSTIGRPRALTQEQTDLTLKWYRENVLRYPPERPKPRKTLHKFAAEIGANPSTVYNVIKRRGQFKKPPREPSEMDKSRESCPSQT